MRDIRSSRGWVERARCTVVLVIGELKHKGGNQDSRGVDLV
jgi:hypothetical protein